MARLVSALVAVTVIVAGCGGDEPAEQTDKAAAAPKPPEKIEGTFDVGGYKLFMRCTGSGSPTVVYVHGHIADGNGGAVSSRGIPALVEGKHRICIYDRPNLGKSDNVPGPISGKQDVSRTSTSSWARPGSSLPM